MRLRNLALAWQILVDEPTPWLPPNPGLGGFKEGRDYPKRPAPYDWQQRMLEPYRVVEVRSVDGTDFAPPEIAARFEGRLFTLNQLEQRGVRITGAGAWLLANGQDWQLKLEPAV